MSFTEFKVGEKFPLPILAQGDGGLFQYDINGAMFLLKLSHIDLIAIEAFRTGKIELGIFKNSTAACFLYKIDGIFNDWGDCPIFINSLPPDKQPKLDGKQDKNLNLCLIDSQLNILLAVRTIRLSDKFWELLDEIAAAQQKSALNTAEYTAHIQQLWQCLTSGQMAAQAAIIEAAAVAFDKLTPQPPLQ